MAELVDALDSDSSGVTRGSSNLLSCTKIKIMPLLPRAFYYFALTGSGELETFISPKAFVETILMESTIPIYSYCPLVGR